MKFVQLWVQLEVSAHSNWGFLGGSVVKNLSSNAGDVGSNPGLGRSPGEGNGNSLQYSCLENPMDREAWRAIVHRVAKSWIQLSMCAHTYIQIGFSATPFLFQGFKNIHLSHFGPGKNILNIL